MLAGKVEKRHKCLYLRGIEDASFTDVWVEGLGSLHYGIFRPATKAEASALRLLTCVCTEEVTMLPFHEEGCCGADTNLNLNITGDSTQLNFALIGDSLHIYGYYRTNCAGELYCLAKQGSNAVELTFSEYRPATNCFDYHAIDFRLPGFTQENYTIWHSGKVVNTIERTKINQPMNNPPSTPYYDLQGRPVANPIRGVYIKEGKIVLIK